MRIVSFTVGDRTGWGVEIDGGIVDLSIRLPEFPTVRALLQADALDRARAALTDADLDLALADVTLLPPVTDPEKILCIGVNYANRNAEYKDGSQEAAYPEHLLPLPRLLRRPRDADRAPAGIRTTRLRGRDRAGDRQAAAAAFPQARRSITSPA